MPREVVSLTDRKIKNYKKDLGKSVNLVKAEYGKYRSKVIGKVPMKVTRSEVFYTLTFKDGKAIKEFPACELNK